jgi:hypothetical protein
MGTTPQKVMASKKKFQITYIWKDGTKLEVSNNGFEAFDSKGLLLAGAYE